MRLFSEKVSPTLTDSPLNIIKVQDFSEIFFGVYEVEINKNKYPVEKISEHNGDPVVSIPVEMGGKIANYPFVLTKGKFEVVFNEQSDYVDIFESKIEDLPEEESNVIEEKAEIFIPEVGEDRKNDILLQIQEAKKNALIAAKKELEIKKSRQIKQIREESNQKKQALESYLESARENLVDEFTIISQRIKKEVFDNNDEKYLEIRETIDNKIGEIRDSLDESLKKDFSKSSQLIDKSIKQLVKDLWENNINPKVDKELHDIAVEIHEKVSEIDNNLNSKLKEKADLSLLEGVDKELSAIRDTNIELNNSLNKGVQKALSRVGNVDKKVIQISEEFERKLDEKEQEVVSYFDEKLVLVKEETLDITDEARKYFQNLIQESRNNLLTEIRKIKAEKPIEYVLETKKSGKVVKDWDSIEKEWNTKIHDKIENVKTDLRKYVSVYASGGGTNATQYQDGGTMNGTLNVMGAYLSAGVNLLDIFGGGSDVSGLSANWQNTYTTVQANSANWVPYNGATTNVNLGTNSLSANTLTLSGQSFAPSGSASAPSYTFTGDPNTGMWSPADDTLAWSTNGVERMRVDSSGNFSAPNILFNDSTSYLQTSNDVRNWYIKGASPTLGEANPNGLFLAPDGLTVFIVGSTLDAVLAYPLSVAWDISTTSTVASATLSITTQDSAPQDLHFSPDGLYLFVIGSTNDRIHRYSMTVAWNLTTATYDGIENSFSVATEELVPTGLTMSNDGLNVYIVGIDSDTIFQYQLTTAWDLTSASLFAQFSVAAQEANPSALCFNNAGTRLYVLGTTGDDITEYRLTVPYDISTASFFSESFTFTFETAPSGLFIHEASENAYMIGTLRDRIEQIGIDKQLKYFGDSFTMDSQFYVGNRAEFKSDVYINGVLTALGQTNVGGCVLNAGGITASAGGTIGSTGNTVSVNLATGAMITNTKTVNIGTLGRFTSTANLSFGSMEAAGSSIFQQDALFRKSVTSNNAITVKNLLDPFIAANSATGDVAVLDTFTEASDLLLQNHIPDTGTGWSRVQVNSATASFTINSATNQLKPTASINDNGVIYVENTNLLNSDYEVSMDLPVQVGADDNIWLIARYQDVNNFYGVKWSTSTANCILYKRVGGVYTQLGSVPVIAPATGASDLVLRVVGDCITVLNGGIVKIGAVDSSISTAGKAGLAGGNIGAVSTDDFIVTWRLDNFKVRYYTHATSVFENGDVTINSGKLGVGVSNPTSTLHAVSTTEQLRLGYDASNYMSTTVSSAGLVTLDAVGAGAGFEFSDPVAVNGNLTLGTAGNKINITEGSDASVGVATLVAGTVTVNTTAVTANSRIFLTRQTTAGTIGTSVDVTARVAGTSFTITSNGSMLDTSTVAWLIIN